MKQKILLTTLLVLVLAAIAATVAVWRAKAPVTGGCDGPLPQGPYIAYRAQAPDGNCLQGYAWPPATPARAVVIVVHGLHDHARRYDVLARGLAASGVAVLAQDHRGHGGSGGAAQRLDSIEQLLTDVDVARAQARARFPGVPQILYGHSLGGMVAAQHVARNPEAWAGAVFSSAALTLPVGVDAGKVRVVMALSALAPGLGLEAVDEAQLVRDPAQREAMAKDTVLSRDKLPARTVATLLGGVQDLQDRMAQITVPALLLHGQQDRVTDPAGTVQAHARIASRDKQLLTFGPALHDLLHEPESAQVIEAVSRFIARRLAPEAAK